MTVTLITGTGRSGTSFVAEVFHRAGVHPGGTYIPQIRGGWEDQAVAVVNRSIRDFQKYPECSESYEILKRFGAAMQRALRGKKVVKDPQFAATLDAWIHTGLVKRVIVMIRPPSEAFKSSQDAGMHIPGDNRNLWSWARLGHLAWACDTHGIPRIPLRFPEVAQEEGTDFQRLATEVQYLGVNRSVAIQAIRETRKPNLIQHSRGTGSV